MSVEATVRSYYEALRRGEPLHPYFAERGDLVKFGVSEALAGYEAVAEGLREQTRTTTDWTVENRRLRTGRHGDVGWFADEVTLEWSDERTDERHAFETRWSGTLVRRDGRWQFTGMHVSAAHRL